MAAKMAVYHKKYKKIFPETDKVQGFACKMLILLILELQTSSLWSQWCCHSAFDIFKMASKIVANNFFQTHVSGTLHVGIMLDL